MRSFPLFERGSGTSRAGGGRPRSVGMWGYESWLERDHVMLLDFDPAVVGVGVAAVLAVLAGRAARMRRHAPDFFARLADGTGVVVDVRPDDRIEPRDAEAFAVTARACAGGGLGVSPGRGAWSRCWWRTCGGCRGTGIRRCGRRRGSRRRLLEVFAAPAPLLAGARQVGDRLAVLPVLFHLMWRQVLAADLTAGAAGPGDRLVGTAGGAAVSGSRRRAVLRRR